MELFEILVICGPSMLVGTFLVYVPLDGDDDQLGSAGDRKFGCSHSWKDFAKAAYRVARCKARVTV